MTNRENTMLIGIPKQPFLSLPPSQGNLMQPNPFSAITIHAVETVDPANPSNQHSKVLFFGADCSEQTGSENDTADKRRVKLTDIIRALGQLPGSFKISVSLSGDSKYLVDEFTSERIYTWGAIALHLKGDDDSEKNEDENEDAWKLLQL